MVASKDLWAGLGSALAVLVGLITMIVNQVKIKLFINKVMAFIDPYMQITIHEYEADGFKRSEFFVAVEAYLSRYCAQTARKLKAELSRDKRKPEVCVDDEQEIQDTLPGRSGGGAATLRWYAQTEHPRGQVIIHNIREEKRRYFRVSFHKKVRQSVLESYLLHVYEKGRDVIAENRQRRLYTNSPSRMGSYWSHVTFQHPATFDMLAMDPAEKKDIMEDLKGFKEGKDYYAKIGKPWKRGYLLFGPPGTGKSTMVAAIANFLQYDVYDLELTAVENNTELRRLFVDTTSKSIIVVEDIDRSVQLTVKLQQAADNSGGGDNLMTSPPKEEDDDNNKEHGGGAKAKLTLSGLLNFIDGLWSACGGERIIIFTTNYKSKLDPALIRRGRMDKHIEMSYCRYEAFKLLASNYLHITEHQFYELFGKIHKLLEEVDMPPANVAEHLLTERKDTDACLKGLVTALEDAKVKAKAKQQVEP